MIRSAGMIALATAALVAAGPALAHHSFAMFELEREVTIKGEVKEVEWTNPHVWIQLMVPNAQGQAQEWGIELGTPGMLGRTGWTRHTLKPGDKVTAIIHPLRNGKPSGSLVTMDVPDGRTLGPGNLAPRPTVRVN
jgi:hypothetical protein